MLYRKITPVEAWPVAALFDGHQEQPEWITQAITRGTISSDGMGNVLIVTLRGSVLAHADDMVLREVTGTGVYPVDRVTFNVSYEPIQEQP